MEPIQEDPCNDSGCQPPHSMPSYPTSSLSNILGLEQEEQSNITIGNYICENAIGSGAFSHVYKAIHQQTHLPVAIKMIPKCDFPYEKFMRELSVMKSLVHPFCVSFYECIEDENNYYLVMEYIQGQTLLDFLNMHEYVPETVIRHLFCQIISALDYLHNDVNFVHRDLKVENIMIDKHNNIRLIDFGLGNIINKENPLLKTACGSVAYAAPELLCGEAYSSKADLWSVGVVLYAMTCGQLPFEDSNIQKLVRKIVLESVDYPKDIHPELEDFLRHILVKDPVQRFSLEQIKDHSWFKKYNFSEDMDRTFGVAQGYRSPDSNQIFIDDQVVSRAVVMGADKNELLSELKNNIYGSASAGYRIILREQVSYSLSALYSKSKMSLKTMAQNSLPSLFTQDGSESDNAYSPPIYRKTRRLTDQILSPIQRHADGREMFATESLSVKSRLKAIPNRHRTMTPIKNPMCHRKRNYSFIFKSPIAFSDGA